MAIEQVSARWEVFKDKLDFAAQRSARYSQNQFALFGWLTWFFPAGAIVDYLITDPSFSTVPVRFSVAILSIPLVVYHRLQPRFKRVFHIYFSVMAGYAFPFTYGLMLSMNASMADQGTQIHMIWILQYFIALFLFIQIVVDGRLATVLWLVASTCAIAPAYLLPNANLEELNRVFVYPITGYLTALAFGIITNRNTEIINAEKASAASAIGANLAHELRTPLASIGTIAQGVTNLLPDLTEAYNKAKNAGMEVKPLRTSQVTQLSNALGSIRREVEYSNTIIDMLLINTADKSLSDVESEWFAVKACISESISRYPFNNKRERELLEVSEFEDFEIRAPRLLIVHVLFNLIKNSLYFVQNAGKGSISVSSKILQNGAQIVVHDTGAGIPAGVLPHVFERFFTSSRTGQGAGIGLSFCRTVMESIGGSISCESKDGEFTTFTLTFPDARVRS